MRGKNSYFLPQVSINMYSSILKKLIKKFFKTKMSTQAQALTPFGEESSNSQHDDPLRLIMQELQSFRDEMRDIIRDVTNLSDQQREISPHCSLNATTPRSNGPFNCSKRTEFHQPPHFDEEFHPPPYSGRRGSFLRKRHD
ncbi:hypothetical protein M9H77_27945 [Catharanthus roseus]|uniref:Uncharacterized protein n=1 Tax=Catharanthus roseus TaxID=4058 RepID=A0ACC0AFE4_CATRO|nr:hypothetical protein M9H77_27945 [Catharanthus roseus]